MLVKGGPGVDGLVQDCGISSVLAKMPQSCAKLPLIYILSFNYLLVVV